MYAGKATGSHYFRDEVREPLEHSQLVFDSGVSGSCSDGTGFTVPDTGWDANKKGASSGRRSGEMAFFGPRNDGPVWRHGNVRVFDWNCMVGFRRFAGRAVHDARFF